MAEEDVGRVAVLLEERVKRLQAHAIKIRVDATIVVHIEDAHGVGALYAAAQDNQRALSSGAVLYTPIFCSRGGARVDVKLPAG